MSPNDTTMKTQELLEHTGWMRRLARRLVEDAARADDVVQEALATALDRSHGARDLRSWLGGVVRQTARNERRGRRRRDQREERAARPEALESTDELVARAELHENLVASVLALREPYREAILLRYFEELEPRAIAERLGVPLNTVRSRIERGTDLLREELDRTHGGDRRAWALAFVPLAAVDGRAAAVAGTGAGAGLGVWMSLHPLRVALALLTVLLGSYFIVERFSAGPEPMVAPATETAAIDTPSTAAVAARELTQGAPAPTRVSIDVAPALSGTTVAMVDLEGEPVIGVDVLRWRGSSGRPVGRTDGTGRLTAAEVEHQEGDAYAIADVGFFALDEHVAPGPDQVARIRVTPKRTFPLGVVVRESGSGEVVPRFVLDALVRYDEDGGSSYPTPSHEAEVLDGAFDQVVEFGEGLPLLLELKFIGATSEHAPLVHTIRPTAGVRMEIELEVDLSAPERASGALVAQGRILDATDGAPIAGARVSIAVVQGEPLAHRGSEARAPLDEMGSAPIGIVLIEEPRKVQSFGDGRFRVALPDRAADGGAAQAFVWVEHPHYEPTLEPALWDGSAPVKIELQRRASLRLTLIDASGTRLPGTPLQMVRTSDAGFRGQSDREYRARAECDEFGVATFEHLRPGRYMLAVLSGPRATDDDALLMQAIDVAASVDQELTIQLGGGDSVTATGTVRAPVACESGYVPYFIPIDAAGSMVVGRPESGGYRAEQLVPGPYLVMLAPASDDEFKTAPIAFLPSVDVPKKSLWTHHFDFPTGSVRGRLTGRDSFEGVSIVVTPIVAQGTASDLLERMDSDWLSSPVEPDGSFHLQSLADGAHLLRVFESPTAQSGATEANRRTIAVNGATDVGECAL